MLHCYANKYADRCSLGAGLSGISYLVYTERTRIFYKDAKPVMVVSKYFKFTAELINDHLSLKIKLR